MEYPSVFESTRKPLPGARIPSVFMPGLRFGAQPLVRELLSAIPILPVAIRERKPDLPDEIQTLPNPAQDGEKCLDDFLTSLYHRPDPERSAGIVKKYLDAFQMTSPQGRSVLHQMVTSLPDDTMETLFHLGKQMAAIGLLDFPDPIQAQSRLFYQCLHLLDAGVPLAEVARLSDVLQPSLPRLDELIDRFSGIPPSMQGKRHDAKLSNRLGFVTLMEEAVAFYLSHPQPGKSFSTVMQEILAEKFKIQSFVREQPPAQTALMCNFLRLSGSISEYRALCEQYRQVSNDRDSDMRTRNAFRALFLGMKTSEGLQETLSLVRDYGEAHGNTGQLAGFFVNPDNHLNQASAAFIRDNFSPLVGLCRKYARPEAREVMAFVLESLWNHPGVPKVRYLDVVDVMTEMAMSLPPTLELEQRLLTQVQMLSAVRDPEALLRLLPRLKILYSDLGRDRDWMLAVGSVLQETGDIDRADMAKSLIQTVMPHYKPEMGDTVQKFYDRLTGIFKDHHELRAPLSNKELETVLHQTRQVVQELAAEHPEKLEKLPLALSSALLLMRERAFDADEFGQYLTAMTDICQMVPSQTAYQLFSSIRTMFMVRPVSFASGIQRFEILKEAIADYNRVLFDSPYAGNPQAGDYTPLIHLYRLILANRPDSEWSRYLRGFPEAISLMGRGERQDLDRFENATRAFFEQASERCYRGKFSGTFPELLEGILKAHETLVTRHEDCDWKSLLYALIEGSASKAAFDDNYQALKVFLFDIGDVPQKQSALCRYLGYAFSTRGESEKAEVIRPLAEKYLAANGNPKDLVLFLSAFVSDANLAKMPLPQFRILMEKALAVSADLVAPQPSFLAEFGEILRTLKDAYDREDRAFISPALLLISELPGNWVKAARVLQSTSGIVATLELKGDAALDTPEKREARMNRFSDNVKLLSLLYQPSRLMNYYMLNRDRIDPATLKALYYYIEHSSAENGRQALPELLALLGPYGRSVNQAFQPGPTPDTENPRSEYLNAATQAITYLYDFTRIDYIGNIQGIVYNNWAKIGTLGLSFTKWQYDAIRRWKNLGPSERPALLKQSGLFELTPPRSNDARYFGGFIHRNSETGTCVELRRAYIVISKPGFGTLVIRNSSPDFGRPLLKEPAYFHPEVVYNDGKTFFNPDEDITRLRFESVTDKALNRSDVLQVKNHTFIQGLLEEFDKVMGPYVDWKCGVKGGKVPGGMREMMNSALMNAKGQGVSSPFGKAPTVKLAWVNPHELPFAVLSYDVTQVQLQQELELYLKVLEGRIQIKNEAEYRQKIPNLLKFLEEGLKHNLELILTP